MNEVTPWWAWTENILRSFDSGALVTASWPPPSGRIENVKNTVSSLAGNIDWLTDAVPIIGGTNLQGSLPSHTSAVDALPLERRDRVQNWSTSFGPFDYSNTVSIPQAAADYCTSWIGSLEWMLNTAQTYAQSNDFKYFKEVFLFNQFAPFLGCTFVSVAWHIQVNSAYLDWIINTPEASDENSWLKAAGNLTYSYVPRESRTTTDRDRYAFVKQDYANPRGADGYFALSRSELVYKPALGTRNKIISGIGNAIGHVPIVGNLVNSRAGIQPEPDMWQPRWTARNRPVALPGESFGAASMNQPAGLNSVINDTIPYLVIGGGIVGGLGVTNASNNFGVQSGIRDVVYLYQSVSSWESEHMHGVPK